MDLPETAIIYRAVVKQRLAVVICIAVVAS
jgi:hypothetical protein